MALKPAIILLPAALFACAEPQGAPERVAAANGQAQPAPPPAHPSPPPPPPTAPGMGPPPGGAPSYYESRYGLSPEEGRRRQANEAHVSALNQWLHQAQPYGFSSMRIEHEPAYEVVIAFKGHPDRAAILARAHPDLRGDIRFESARRSFAELTRDNDRIVAALRPIRAPWSGGYDVRTQRFRFTFASPDSLEQARRRVPADLRDDVVLEIGSVPQPL